MTTLRVNSFRANVPRVDAAIVAAIDQAALDAVTF